MLLLKLLCGNSGRGGNVFLKQSLVRGVWVYYSWIPIWRRYNGLRIVLNNQRMNDPANMPSRGSVQFSAVPSGPALGFSVGRLGRHWWNTWVYYIQYYMCAKYLRGEQSLTLSRLRGCRMWVEGEEGRSENEDDGPQERRPLQTIANAHKRKMRRQKRTGKYCLKSLKVWNVSRRVWVKGIGGGMRTLVICKNNKCPPLQHNHVKLNTQKDILCYWLTQGGWGEKIVKER